jgi:polar amino acid transport system permease protein
VIGVAGAWLQGSRLRVTRKVVYWYIQFFNTPPLVQLYFYFGIGSLLKAPPQPAPRHLINNFAWRSFPSFLPAHQRRDLPVGR